MRVSRRAVERRCRPAFNDNKQSSPSNPPQAILAKQSSQRIRKRKLAHGGLNIEERSSSSAPFANIAVQNEVPPLDNQDRRSDGLARLEIAMRLCSLFQRIGLIDLDLDRA